MVPELVRKGIPAVILAAGLVSWGCGDASGGGEIAPPVPQGPEAPIRVMSLDLGRSIDADMRINDGLSADEFAPSDTIFASVATEGTLGNAIVTARWTSPTGEVLSESARAISPTRATVVAFQLADPDGFAAGGYTVTILLNGVAVESREFVVR